MGSSLTDLISISISFSYLVRRLKQPESFAYDFVLKSLVRGSNLLNSSFSSLLFSLHSSSIQFFFFSIFHAYYLRLISFSF